ncbi:hypothetical protein HMPREF1051_2418 [Neisseria sicca VK64]|uniref:Uncharacterized protein n=1 Tax=Neisseria sicca VK64 TaxID=1095748 RepID=I2NSM8_NEISI|nr:hypothetical protein HMPREF1051_2418 [Neisseria sicca VK64]
MKRSSENGAVGFTEPSTPFSDDPDIYSAQSCVSSESL